MSGIGNCRRVTPAAVRLAVRITPEAEAQIRNIDDWWRKNRTFSPNLFVDELAAAFEIISRAPGLGRSYRLSPVAGTRRVLLKRSHYPVYYIAGADEARVLAIGTRDAAKVHRFALRYNLGCRCRFASDF